MKNNCFLVLGGYGNAGLPICRLLLSETGLNIHLAGRDLQKAKSAADELNRLFPGNRASGMKVDAGNTDDLKAAFRNIDMVVVASSSSQYTREVASACLEAGIDYFDIQYAAGKFEELKAFEFKIQGSGRCFISEGGFHPGLPAALIRYGANFFDSLEKAITGSLIRMNWKNLRFSETTAREFTRELIDFQGTFYKNGIWRKASLWTTRDFIKVNMGKPYGKQMCTPMFLEELRELPEEFPSLKHMGFYVAGFHWFVDMFIFPVIFLFLKIFPTLMLRPMTRLLTGSLRYFTGPPYITILKLETEGLRENRRKRLDILLSHPDSYQFTAIPAVACLLQYLDGSARKPGLWCMGRIADPKRLMADIRRMGIEFQITEAPI